MCIGWFRIAVVGGLQDNLRTTLGNINVKYTTIVAQSLNNCSMVKEFDGRMGRLYNEIKCMQ